MKLYFTDSRQNKKLLSDKVETTEQGIELIARHQRTRFSFPKTIKFLDDGNPNQTRYVNADGSDSGYTIEK